MSDSADYRVTPVRIERTACGLGTRVGAREEAVSEGETGRIRTDSDELAHEEPTTDSGVSRRSSGGNADRLSSDTLPFPGIRFQARFWGRTALQASGCIEWTGSVTSSGYGNVRFRGRNIGTHRMAWEMTRGPIPPGKHVAHGCDNRRCVTVAHLFLATHAENMADKVAKGRQCRGEDVTGAKLTEAEVRAIRAEYARGRITQKSLAGAYGVSQQAISDLTRGVKWKHVTAEVAS